MKLVATLAAIFMFATTATVATADGEPEVVMLTMAPPGVDLFSVIKPIQVLETYRSFLLASVTPIERSVLESLGFEVLSLPDRTLAGRGAFVFDTRFGEPAIPDTLRVDRAADPGYDLLIVQLIGPVQQSWTEELRSLGVELFDYLPSYSYLAAMSSPTENGVRQLRFVQWVGPYHPAYKLDPTLLRIEGLETSVLISVLPGRSAEAVALAIVEGGGRLLSRWTGWNGESISANVPVTTLVGLARMREVSWIDFVGSQTSPANSQATWVVQTFDTINKNRRIHEIDATGIRGQGQRIALSDTGLNTSHEMFTDVGKVVLYSNTLGCGDLQENLNTGHGTHVAGTLAGDAPPYDTYGGYDGHAFAADIIFQDLASGSSFCNTLAMDITPLWTQARDNGAWIHSNSWGDPASYNYCSNAAQADSFMRSNLNFLILFVAGNEGLADGTATKKIRCQGQAKNVITVGGTQNEEDANLLYCIGDGDCSSPGPAEDGRRKPTVVAPGQYVTSARADARIPVQLCQPTDPKYCTSSGTSMATPAVAGSAALVRQYFMEGWACSPTPCVASGVRNGGPSVIPSAALMKAMLVNSGVRVSDGRADFPNSRQGWGRILLDDVLYFTGDARKLMVLSNGDSLAQSGDFKQYFINVSGSSQPLEINLVWTDNPAAANANPALVNDLDLLVIDPNGNVYKGNWFGEPPVPGDSQPNGSPDFRNVEEGVMFPQGSAKIATGVWTVRVIGRNLPQRPQPFALVATGDVSGVSASSLGVTISPDTQTVFYNPNGCLLPTADFSSTVTGGSSSVNLLYIWDFGDGVMATPTKGMTSTSHTYPLADGATFTATLTVTDSVSIGGKAGADTASVTVRQTRFC